MEAVRRTRTNQMVNMQENILVNKSKMLQSTKEKIPTVTTKRAVLGNLNGNARLLPVVGKTKPIVSNEVQKPTITCTKPVTRKYKNVNAKVDTGFNVKPSNVNMKIYDENDQKRFQCDENATVAAKTKIITTNLKNAKISNETKRSSKENLLPKEPTKKEEEKIDIKHLLNPVFKDKLETLRTKTTNKAPPKKESYSTELLDGVEDIDSKDGKSLILMGIYIKDIYNYLMELESMYPIEPQHLNGQLVVTPNMRATLIDWLVEVHYQFNLNLETLHMTVAIIDRYSQIVKTIRRSQIQLIGITALFIASKYEEMYVPDIQDFVYITDHTYTKTEILQCEKAILSKLEFNLGRPLPLHFERRFIKAARAIESRHHNFAKYVMDLCMVDYEMAHYRPSEIAAAAVCLSISVLSPTTMPEKCWTPTLTFYSGYKYENIDSIITKMAKIVISAETSNFKAVISKYNSSKFGKVPSYPELKGNLIKNIANKDQSDS